MTQELEGQGTQTATAEVHLVASARVGLFRIAGEMDYRSVAYHKGGSLCQSARFNRGDAAAPRRTVSARA
jgi:hypothetical protein